MASLSASVPTAPASRSLLVFDHGAAAYLIEILLRALLVTLGSQRLSCPALTRRVVGCGFLPPADRKHLDPKLRHLRWGQLADLDIIQHFAQLRRKVGGAADDLLSARHIPGHTGKTDTLPTALEAVAQRFRIPAARLDDSFRSAGRNEQ